MEPVLRVRQHERRFPLGLSWMSSCPRVESLKTADGRPVRLSHDGKDRAVTGGSTGGIGSFTLASERPTPSAASTASSEPSCRCAAATITRRSCARPSPRRFAFFWRTGRPMHGTPFGSWYTANLNMEAALTFAGYDVQHAWGEHGHDGGPGNVILPDVLRWLWRGWPAPVRPAYRRTTSLAEILRPGEGWLRVDGDYRGVSALASNPKGEVFFSDAASHTLCRVNEGGRPEVYSRNAPPVGGQAFGPNGTLYATLPSEGGYLRRDAQGGSRKMADGIRGSRILATAAGELYVSEPGAHSDEPSKIWLLKADGARTLVDQVPASVSGIAFSADMGLFLAAERSTARIDSSVAAGSGELQDREPFYWLHAADAPAGHGTGDIAVDTLAASMPRPPSGSRSATATAGFGPSCGCRRRAAPSRAFAGGAPASTCCLRPTGTRFTGGTSGWPATRSGPSPWRPRGRLGVSPRFGASGDAGHLKGPPRGKSLTLMSGSRL